MNPNIIPKGVKNPFRYFCMSIGAIPTSYKETLSYYETLLYLIRFLEDKVIPAVDNNAQALEELQSLFLQLQQYVTNYFDNLDVQEEINNKLDDMVEQGTLQEIIADYLNSKAVFGFDNVEALKEATNLIDGSYAKTLGYYDVNDGGSSLYKIRTITNNDVVDDEFIVALNDETLIAELIIIDELNIKQIGAKGDNINDDTNKLKNAISKCNNIYIPSGEYKITDTIEINTNKKIYGDGYTSRINYTEDGFLFDISSDISHKPIINNLRLNGTSENSCIKCAKDSFGASFIIENCSITGFNEKIFELTSVFDPIIRNIRIISAGKILFNTYDGEYGENSFSNNILFEHVYVTGNPDSMPLLFDLNNVRYLNFIGCQFEKITKLIEAKNKTKYVILNQSWVESVTNFYTVDGTSDNIRAINTNVTLTTNYNGDATVLDYLDGNDKEVINIKNTNNDSFNAILGTDNITLKKMLVYNKNNPSYPYADIFRIGTKKSTFNMPVNITKHEVTNNSTASYQVKNITNYSNIPVMFNFLVDVVYSDYSERIYEFKYFQKSLTGYRLCEINKIYETTWQNSATSLYEETITQDSGTVTVTSTGTMANCTMRIRHEFV